MCPKIIASLLLLAGLSAGAFSDDGSAGSASAFQQACEKAMPDLLNGQVRGLETLLQVADPNLKLQKPALVCDLASTSSIVARSQASRSTGSISARSWAGRYASTSMSADMPSGRCSGRSPLGRKTGVVARELQARVLLQRSSAAIGRTAVERASRR